MTDREDYTLSTMLALPRIIGEMIEDDGVPSVALSLLSDLLDNGLPLRDHSEGDDRHVDRLERNIELLRLAFAQWATRNPRWGGDSPLVRHVKFMYSEDV